MSILWGAAQMAFLATAALGYGGAAYHFLRMEKTPLEHLVTRFALGLGWVIMATIAAGWLRIWGPWFHHGLLAGGMLLMAARPLRTTGSSWLSFRKRHLFWAGPGLALLFFYATFPPTFYDALLYHLGLPAYYLQAGGFAAWPENVFSALPLNAEMLNLLLLSGGSVHGPKFLSLIAALALLLYLADWGRAIRLRHPWLPALIFFSIPEVIFLAATEKNDLLLMLFMLLAVRLMTRLKDDPGNWRTLIAAAFFFGLACGVKWQGLLYAAAFIAAYFLTARASLLKRLLQVVLVALVILLLVSPWLLKNQATFSNPVHPYLSGFFNDSGEAASQARQIREGVRRSQGFAPGDLISFLRRMFLSPYSLGLTHIMGVMMLLLLPLLFLKGNIQGSAMLLAGCAAGFLLLLAVSRVPRYFLPIFMVLSMPLAAGWEKMEEKLPRYRRLAVLLLFMLVSIQALQAASLLERMTLGARYVLGTLRHELPARARYLDIVPYYPAVDFINAHLPENSRIAFIGEERTFYLQRPFLASSSFDRNPVLADFLAAKDMAAWVDRLRHRGLTHILYAPGMLTHQEKISPLLRMPPADRRRLESTLATWPELYNNGRYAVYRVAR